MSDEEKEALEILNNTEWDGFMITIKNLIEKQSKEIKELKEKNKDARERIEYYLVGNFALNDFDKRNKELRKIEKILEE